jgi:hypothetical protein
MLVKVRVIEPVGVHLKLLVTFMSNEPSLSVVTVPRCEAEKVCTASEAATVKVASGTVTVRLADGEAEIVDVKLVEPPLIAIAMIIPYSYKMFTVPASKVSVPFTVVIRTCVSVSERVLEP